MEELVATCRVNPVAYLTLDDPSVYAPSNDAYQLPIMSAGHLPRHPITNKFMQLGCFSNVLLENGFNPGTDWEDALFTPSSDVNYPMVEQCVDRCADMGHTYSALYRSNNYCWCGTVMPEHSDWGSSSQCNPCGDAGNYRCGNSWSMAISELGPPTAFDPSLSAYNGVEMPQATDRSEPDFAYRVLEGSGTVVMGSSPALGPESWGGSDGSVTMPIGTNNYHYNSARSYACSSLAA